MIVVMTIIVASMMKIAIFDDIGDKIMAVKRSLE